MFASRIVFAEPSKLPLAIFLMNFGTSMWVGHAAMHGASKQYRHLWASITAAVGSNGGCKSAKRVEISAVPGACATKLVNSLMKWIHLLLGYHALVAMYATLGEM
jgi:hypothetical protein